MQTLSFKNPEYEIKTRYSIEYLMASSENSAQRWELYQYATERGSDFEPWELLDEIELDDVGAAWEFYLARLLDAQTYVVKPIFEEILVNGLTAREAYKEETPTFLWNLRGWVDREVRDDLDRLQGEEKINAELLSDYAEFTKKLGGEQHFMEFRDQKWKERNS